MINIVVDKLWCAELLQPNLLSTVVFSASLNFDNGESWHRKYKNTISYYRINN